MDRYKFRGKCKRGYDYSNGDGWVYGSLLTNGNESAIVRSEDIDLGVKCDDGISNIEDFAFIPVEPETLGQFTGLTDKNCKDIYEDDIIKIHEGWNDYKVSSISWCIYTLRFKLDNDKTRYYLHEHYKKHYEIIGNIHDNKDLLNNK